MISKYAIRGYGLPHSSSNVTAWQFRWLHSFSFCLNIKSWRTTITLDSSTIILHFLHKSKWGGKALAGCLTLLIELMCQLQFFAVVTRSKKSTNQARGGCFLERLVTQLFYRCIFENLVVWLASQERVTDTQIAYIGTDHLQSVYPVLLHFLVSMKNVSWFLWHVVNHLLLLSPSSPLPVCPTATTA